MTDTVFLILMDVPAALEEKFNRIYDNDHLTHMMRVPAVRRCDRYRLDRSDNSDMQRYLALYEIDDPAAPQGEDWKRQGALGAWPTEMRPHIQNRRNGAFTRLSTHGEWSAGDGFGPTIYLLQQGVPAELEERFDTLYETDHLPLMMQVPGISACSRWKLVRSDTGEVPDYLALYGIDDVGLPKSPAWQAQTGKGRWPTEMRPHFTARRNGVFQRIASHVNPPA